MNDSGVTSEVHEASVLNGNENDSQAFRISRYHIKEDLENDAIEDQNTTMDEDIDESTPKRRRMKDTEMYSVSIYHLSVTPIDDVGLQLWRGALLLADYLIDQKMQLSHRLVVELGAGVGFLGVIMDMLSVPFYATDYTDEICSLTQRNLQLNQHMSGRLSGIPSSPQNSTGNVRKLDWCDVLDNPRNNDNEKNTEEDDKDITETGRSKPNKDEEEVEEEEASQVFAWSSDDRCLLCSSNVLFLAADVIYDDDLTDAFFVKLDTMMHVDEELWLSLEKRYNFTVADMAVVAHGYRRFLQIINALHHYYTSSSSSSSSSVAAASAAAAAASTHQHSAIPTTAFFPTDVSHKVNNDNNNNNSYSTDSTIHVMPSGRMFRGRPIPLDFPQRVLNYRRCDDLELWCISLHHQG